MHSLKHLSAQLVKVKLEHSLTSGAWMVESLSSLLRYLLPICMYETQPVDEYLAGGSSALLVLL